MRNSRCVAVHPRARRRLGGACFFAACARLVVAVVAVGCSSESGLADGAQPIGARASMAGIDRGDGSDRGAGIDHGATRSERTPCSSAEACIPGICDGRGSVVGLDGREKFLAGTCRTVCRLPFALAQTTPFSESTCLRDEACVESTSGFFTLGVCVHRCESPTECVKPEVCLPLDETNLTLGRACVQPRATFVPVGGPGG